MTDLDVAELRTGDLSDDLLSSVRQLLLAGFSSTFSDDDWHHALGGWHCLVLREARLVSHAAVVPRELHVGVGVMSTGYVEAVATDPELRGRGLGSLAMRAAAAVLHREFEMGALSTGAHRFYERLGWERWRGPTYVRRHSCVVRTPDEDDGIMALRFGPSASLDLTLPVSCDARAGDDW